MTFFATTMVVADRTAAQFPVADVATGWDRVQARFPVHAELRYSDLVAGAPVNDVSIAFATVARAFAEQK